MHSHRNNIQRIGWTLLALGVLTVVFAGQAAAQSASYGMPGDWLSRYTGARTTGLGGAFVAIADDPFGALWNPAGLHQMSQNEVMFETNQYFEDTSINALGFTVPASSFPTLGLSVFSLNSGGFEKTNELNETLGEFGQNDLAFLVTGSKRLNKRFSVGANLKIVRQQFEDFNATGVGADLGVLMQVTPALTLGASALNLAGPTVNLRGLDETFPAELRGGLAYRFFAGRGVVSAEADYRDGPGTTFRAGTEVWVHDKMGLRVGYGGQSAGGGVSYKATHAMRLDYGVSNHELGLVHRVGISYRFGGFFANSYAQPEVFSPMGENSVTKFHIKSKTKAETADWALEIFDKHGEQVRRFGGKGVPPAHVMWDGKNEAGLTLPDGNYTYRVTVRDDEGRIIRAEEKTVEILTSGPQGGTPIIVE